MKTLLGRKKKVNRLREAFTAFLLSRVFPVILFIGTVSLIAHHSSL
jgi:hypothetical protein